MGVTIDLGNIKLSDYKTFKITFQTQAGGATTYIYLNGVLVDYEYGGAHTVDLKAVAENKGLTAASTLELSLSSGTNVTSCEIYIASIELELQEELEEYTKQTVTYSVQNGNLTDIVASLGYGTVSNHTFGSVNSSALLYKYTGDALTGDNVGVTIDLGNIKLSDYKTFKITFQTVATPSNAGTIINFNGSVDTDTLWGGAHTVDLKELAEGKGLTTVSTLKLSLSIWANVTSCEIYIASIEFELAD